MIPGFPCLEGRWLSLSSPRPSLHHLLMGRGWAVLCGELGRAAPIVGPLLRGDASPLLERCGGKCMEGGKFEPGEPAPG
jgi:hypothetical protein